jgi:hypothetical protein
MCSFDRGILRATEIIVIQETLVKWFNTKI